MAENIRIIFFGTPEFAIPPLEALAREKYEIVAVVTRPDEPVGRKQVITPPPIKVWADKHHIPVFQPLKLEIGNGKLEIPDADLFVVAAFGKIIPLDILEFPRLGALNIHPSLLPRWRGPSPIQQTIMAGDTKTGVTIIKIDEFMDHGPILAQRGWPLKNSKITLQELTNELWVLGADLLIEILAGWIRGEMVPIPQDDAQATFSKLLKKDSGRGDWEKTAG